MNARRDWLLLAALALLGAALLALYLRLDFLAYRQRFPDAEWWTYFFQLVMR